MSKLTTTAKKQAVRKTAKEELRRNKQRQFIFITSIVFIILFVFSMCVTVIAASIKTTGATNDEVKGNESTSDNITSNAITATYNSKVKNIIVGTDETTESKVTEAQPENTEPVAEEETEPMEEVKSYSEDDLYYLAVAVCREAGGESEEIQLLVANVIMNRVNSSLYPNTIYEVLTQHKQYGTMWKYGISFPDWADQRVKDQCYSVAKRILEGERYCPENVLFQAEFEQGSGIFKQFGDDYYFCYYG